VKEVTRLRIAPSRSRFVRSTLTGCPTEAFSALYESSGERLDSHNPSHL
jgi:hypothetical protein